MPGLRPDYMETYEMPWPWSPARENDEKVRRRGRRREGQRGIAAAGDLWLSFILKIGTRDGIVKKEGRKGGREGRREGRTMVDDRDEAFPAPRPLVEMMWQH